MTAAAVFAAIAARARAPRTAAETPFKRGVDGATIAPKPDCGEGVAR